jgi:hypothetical protein
VPAAVSSSGRSQVVLGKSLVATRLPVLAQRPLSVGALPLTRDGAIFLSETVLCITDLLSPVAESDYCLLPRLSR